MFFRSVRSRGCLNSPRPLRCGIYRIFNASYNPTSAWRRWSTFASMASNGASALSLYVVMLMYKMQNDYPVDVLVSLAYVAGRTEHTFSCQVPRHRGFLGPQMPCLTQASSAMTFLMFFVAISSLEETWNGPMVWEWLGTLAQPHSARTAPGRRYSERENRRDKTGHCSTQHLHRWSP
jgi:hypothetical protein